MGYSSLCLWESGGELPEAHDNTYLPYMLHPVWREESGRQVGKPWSRTVSGKGWYINFSFFSLLPSTYRKKKDSKLMGSLCCKDYKYQNTYKKIPLLIEDSLHIQSSTYCPSWILKWNRLISPSLSISFFLRRCIPKLLEKVWPRRSVP